MLRGGAVEAGERAPRVISACHRARAARLPGDADTGWRTGEPFRCGGFPGPEGGVRPPDSVGPDRHRHRPFRLCRRATLTIGMVGWTDGRTSHQPPSPASLRHDRTAATPALPLRHQHRENGAEDHGGARGPDRLAPGRAHGRLPRRDMTGRRRRRCFGAATSIGVGAGSASACPPGFGFRRRPIDDASRAAPTAGGMSRTGPAPRPDHRSAARPRGDPRAIPRDGQSAWGGSSGFDGSLADPSAGGSAPGAGCAAPVSMR